MLCKNGADLKNSVVSLSAKMYIHPTQLPEWMLASVCFWKPRMCWNFIFLSAVASLSFRFIFSFTMWQDCVMPQMRQENVPTSRQKQPFYCHKLNLKISGNSLTAWRGFFLVRMFECHLEHRSRLTAVLPSYYITTIPTTSVNMVWLILWVFYDTYRTEIWKYPWYAGNINVNVDSGNFLNLCSPGFLFLKGRSDQTR